MKRSEIIKELNKKIQQHDKRFVFKPWHECSIEITVDGSPFIRDGSFIQLNEHFYEVVDAELCAMGFNAKPVWNNTGTIFSIWKAPNTLAYETEE